MLVYIHANFKAIEHIYLPEPFAFIFILPYFCIQRCKLSIDR